MDRPSRQSGEECSFTDAIGVEVCETGHGLSENSVQFIIFYMSVGPIQTVLLKRNVSDAAALATLNSFTTVSFCRPRKNSKSITTSLSPAMLD